MGEPHHIGNLESEDDQYTAIIDRVYATDPDPANAIKRALANLLQQPWTYAPIMKAIHAFGVLPDPAALRGLLDAWESHRHEALVDARNGIDMGASRAHALSQCYRDLNHIPGVSASGQTPPPTVEPGPATTAPVGGVE